jgi:gliding motility-associated-like protein
LLTIEAIPTANAGPDQTVCVETTEVQLSGTITNAPSGTWGTNGTGTFSPSPNVLDPVYIFSDQDQLLGNVILSLTTVQNGVCPNAIDLLEIDINTPLIADFSWNGQCEKNTIQFTDQTIINAGTIDSFEWEFGDGGSSQVQNPAHIYEASGTYDVELIVYSNLGCSDSTTLQVQIFENPQPGFVYEETETNFEIQFISEALGVTSFEWEFGDGSGMSVEENPSYLYSQEGVYTVTQFVRNDAGCNDSLSQVVSVTNPATVPPVTPDAFSPNGDGVNDVFFIRGGPFTKMNLKIYDGWGELIFETDDLEGGWDGSYKGQKVQMGVYIYIVDAIGVNGKIYKIQGNITVIK